MYLTTRAPSGYGPRVAPGHGLQIHDRRDLVVAAHQTRLAIRGSPRKPCRPRTQVPQAGGAGSVEFPGDGDELFPAS
jgi:hypothetical protein